MVTTEEVMKAMENGKNTPKFDLSLIEDYQELLDPYFKPTEVQMEMFKNMDKYLTKIREKNNIKIISPN